MFKLSDIKCTYKAHQWKGLLFNFCFSLQNHNHLNLNFLNRYIKAAKIGEDILISANTLKAGRTLAFLSVDITNKETGAMIAAGKHTKFIG